MLQALACCALVLAPADGAPPQADAPAATQPLPYQPAGAPADPRVPASWNFYRSYDQAVGLMRQLAAAYPELCRLQSLGKSYEGRDMWLMTLSATPPGSPPEAERAAFWIDGGIHANELQAVDVTLYTAWFLCETYGRNPTTTRLLRERVFYIVPMMSPDSREAHMQRPNTTNTPRTGQQPVDDDRDGLIDEDPADDLDGDGQITQMRVRDPNGRLKPHPDFPELLIPAKPDEPGEYRLLGAEGIDQDGDGRVNEDGDGYYDPNRGWAWQWQPGYVQGGAIHYPFSLAENRAVADFVMAHPQIAGAQSYHNTGGMILRGPGAKEDRWPQEDIQVFDLLGKEGEGMLPGYRYLNTATALYDVWGGETDWFYGMQGVFAFVNELNTPFNLFREQGPPNDWFGPEAQRYRFDKRLLLGDGFVPWRAASHPTYGEIEVGGQKKTWGRQPPSFLLEEECHRNMAFTLFHADQMPLVEVQKLDVKTLASEAPTTPLRQVTVTLVNNRLIPSRSKHDLDHQISPPERVEIRGEGLQVVAAMTSLSGYFDDTRAVPREPASVRIDRFPSREPRYVRWLVTGDGPVEVTVRTTKGGVARAVGP